MKASFYTVLLLIGGSLFGQSLKNGKLVDAEDDAPIPQAHIRNLSTSLGTVSNFSGEFQMKMDLGDTLLVSCVGYQSIGFIVAEEWQESDNILIEMIRDTILLEELTITRLPNETIFKQRILEYQPNDTSLEIVGLQKPARGPNPLLRDDHVKSLGFAVNHPISFIYHNFSKKAKEKRKMHEIDGNRFRNHEIQQKFNRQYVGELTGLKGDTLTNFILYCDFDKEWLFKTDQYMIAETIMIKLLEFKKDVKG